MDHRNDVKMLKTNIKAHFERSFLENRSRDEEHRLATVNVTSVVYAFIGRGPEKSLIKMYVLVLLAQARLNYSQFKRGPYPLKSCQEFYAYSIPEKCEQMTVLITMRPKTIDFLNYWRQVETCFDDSFNFVRSSTGNFQ